ncbi:MAG: hypothetical protein ACFFDN_20905, partial [Candidatus Hodarchaeota archaeon]
EPEYCIYEKLGISHDSWFKYKNKYSELKECIKKGEQQLTKHIESLLVRKCKGYEVEETKTYIQKNGDKETKKIEKINKHIPSSDVAIIFALKNLAPSKWKDRQEFKQDITQKVQNLIIDIEDDEDE